MIFLPALVSLYAAGAELVNTMVGSHVVPVGTPAIKVFILYYTSIEYKPMYNTHLF